MGSHLFSLASHLGGLFSENLGSASCGPHSTGGVSTRPELPTLTLTSRRPPGSLVRATAPSVRPLPLSSPGTQGPTLRGGGAAPWPGGRARVAE